MNMGRGISSAVSSLESTRIESTPIESAPAQPAERGAATSLANLVVDLQARGLQVQVPLERRHGGAGPSDSGMLWVGGFPITVPTDNATAADSPYALKAEDDGYAIFRAVSGWLPPRHSSAHASMTSRPL